MSLSTGEIFIYYIVFVSKLLLWRLTKPAVFGIIIATFTDWVENVIELNTVQRYGHPNDVIFEGKLAGAATKVDEIDYDPFSGHGIEVILYPEANVEDYA